MFRLPRFLVAASVALGGMALAAVPAHAFCVPHGGSFGVCADVPVRTGGTYGVDEGQVWVILPNGTWVCIEVEPIYTSIPGMGPYQGQVNLPHQCLF